MANQGEAKAQYEWGMILIDGDKVKQDTITGRKWIAKSAQQGYTDAETQLGRMYSNGEGIPAEVSLYENGNDVKQSYGKAFDYYKKSANKGYDKAESQIDKFYHFGLTPIKRDYTKAKMWFEKAAQQNNNFAKNQLADMYCFGIGVSMNTKKSGINV